MGEEQFYNHIMSVGPSSDGPEVDGFRSSMVYEDGEKEEQPTTPKWKIN
jgi:hypothetical protein